MFLLVYGAAVLVLLIHGNVGDASVRTTGAVREKQDRTFDKGELARLIHQVIDVGDDGETFDDDGETFDDAGETFDDAGETLDDDGETFADDGETSDDDVGKVTKQNKALDPLDFGYFDIMTGGLKSGMKNIANFLGKNYANGVPALNPRDNDYNVRVHFIKNPEVLQQYKKKLIERYKSTSSSSSSSDESLEYYRNVKNLVRRNAVFRLGEPLDQGIVHENQKLALRNGEERGPEKSKNNRREENRNLHVIHKNDDISEKIAVAFKNTRHDDYNDNSQRETSKLNRNKFDEEPVKIDIWDNIAKNINKWKNYKNRENDEKKQDADDNHKKTANAEYGNWHVKALNRRETKSRDWYSKNDSEKSKKDNSWANWTPKSMEQTDLHIDNNKGNKLVTEDWDRPITNNEWDQHKKSRDWHQVKKSNDWEESKKNYDYGHSKITKGWDRKKNNDYNQPDKTKERDSSKQNDDYDQPMKTNNRDQTNDHSWGYAKPTKDIADFERDPKADYFDKERLRKEKKKITANERERAIVHNAGKISNKKPFVPKIPEYYNPKSRIHENPGIVGSKPFGRTSIPFVGKRGIYEDK